jgi:hypothetical protein
MPFAIRESPEDRHRYTMAELIHLRRRMLQFSRATPRGHARNQHLQIAILLRRLFRNKAWLDAHT